MDWQDQLAEQFIAVKPKVISKLCRSWPQMEEATIEDLYCEAWPRLVRAAERAPIRSMGTLMYTITNGMLMDWYKREMGHTTPFSLEEHDCIDMRPIEAEQRETLVARVQRALRCIPLLTRDIGFRHFGLHHTKKRLSQDYGIHRYQIDRHLAAFVALFKMYYTHFLNSPLTELPKSRRNLLYRQVMTSAKSSANH